MKKKAIFLDRDGTINIEKNYLYKKEEWEWIPGSIEAIKLINKLGYLAIVVTNQAGIARGYYTEADVLLLHTFVDEQLKLHQAHIDAYYLCPHHTEHGLELNCECRKPKPGMLQKAERDWNLDLSQSWLVGDKLTDIHAAQQVGVKSILVRTGYGNNEKCNSTVVTNSNLLSAIEYIAGNIKL